MQAAGSTDRAALQANMAAVANAPGVKIEAGQLDYGLFLLKNGVGIDYVGATNVEFLENGDIPGSYKELIVEGGSFETVTVR
jgi:branched-chain amino acid transport system substrate-binding protein